MNFFDVSVFLLTLIQAISAPGTSQSEQTKHR